MDLAELSEVRNGYRVARNTPETWEELKQFQLRPDDIFIVTYPKSGTTWMQQIVKLLRNGGQPDDVRLDRAIPWLEALSPDCYYGKVHGYTPEMATSSDLLFPRAFKSHLPYELVPGGPPHTTPAKYIYVMRNPKDVWVSYWYHQNNTEYKITWDDHVAKILKNEIPFGDWFDHILSWWRHDSAQTSSLSSMRI